MDISRIEGPFGIAVEGVDLSHDITDRTVRRLIDLLHEHQVMVIRNPGLSNADYVRFSYKWGRPLSFLMKSHTRDDFPEIIKVHNSASIPVRYRDGAKHWHSDSSYEAEPAAVTMLYGVETPIVGGETLFASTRLAYEALDEATRQRIEPMIGLHCLFGSPGMPGEEMKLDLEHIARMGLHPHPMVKEHPVTGSKALYLSATAAAIEGMDSDEARALIASLREHATRPEFITSYKIREGEIILWDNFQIMHTATPIEYSDEPGKRRMLYRISTKGIPDLCRVPAPA